jgi:hypothetical protein
LIFSASNRPYARGGRPSGRVVSSRAENHRWIARSDGAQPSWAIRTRRTCAAVRAGFSLLQPDRQLDHLRVGARRALPRRRDQRVEPAGFPGGDPPVDGLAGHADRAPERAGVLTAGYVPHDPAALPGCQGRVHRRLDQRPPPQRDGLRPLPPRGGVPVCCRHAFLRKSP